MADQDIRERILNSIVKLRQLSKDAESGEHLTRVVADGFSTLADLFDVFENDIPAPITPAIPVNTGTAAAPPPASPAGEKTGEKPQSL